MDIIEYKQTNQAYFRRHPWEQARSKMLAFMLSRCPSKKNIVDVGSGDAWLAMNVANQNPNSVVIAADINYDEHILTRINTTKPSNLFLINNLDQANSNLTGKVDTIVLMDVLEHVAEPLSFLKEIIEKLPLSEHVHFIITVPAYQSLFSQHDRNLGHYKRYTRKELVTLIRSSGLISVRSGYCFNSLLIPRWFQVQKEKNGRVSKSVEEGIHGWKGGGFITSLLKNIFWIEFKISWYLSRLGINIPGLTCYCICRHSQ